MDVIQHAEDVIVYVFHLLFPHIIFILIVLQDSGQGSNSNPSDPSQGEECSTSGRTGGLSNPGGFGKHVSSLAYTVIIQPPDRHTVNPAQMGARRVWSTPNVPGEQSHAPERLEEPASVVRKVGSRVPTLGAPKLNPVSSKLFLSFTTAHHSLSCAHPC